MTAILEQLQGLVAAAEIPAGTLGVALILGLFGLMVVGLVLGQELAFVLGGAGVIVGWLAWGTPGVTIAMTKIYDQMQSYSMVAIPMFVLMANFLTHSKVADGLFESIRYLLGPLKGGLGLAVILVSTVFAATTGIVGASVVTMGMLSLPVLLRSGYKPSLACGMVCAGGSLGILIPPSIMLVSMGSYAEVSVGKIFFAAMVPGLSLSLGYIIYLMVVCHIHPDWGPAMSPEELAEMPLKKRITGSLINLIPPLILIFGVLGSIFGGIATPTEAAGIGALFSLILAIFYKQFSWKMLYESLIDTAKTTAMVFIILFGAAAFTGVFMSLDGDQIIADWVLSMGIGKWGAFAIMMVIMFLLGMFIDWLGIVMIVFPIFLPIMDTFGFDRLWLVAVSATLLQTCFMTPPFGFALFYVKGILPPSIKIQEVYRGVIPFIIIICAFIALGIMAFFAPLPEVKAAGEDESENEAEACPYAATKTSVFQFPHLLLGCLALFLYVGVETVSLGTLVDYAKELGLEGAANYAWIAPIGIVIGYICGIIFIPKYLSQATALKICSILAIIGSLLVVLTPSHISIYFISFMALGCSLMWPALWPLAMADLGKFTKAGSSLLIMAMFGGAVIPTLYGWLKDVASPQQAYWLCLPCFLFILYYGVAGYKIRTK